jgi:tRNA(adenine34) deaminase
MGAIVWSRVGRVVFAASLAQLASRIDQIILRSTDVAAMASFVHISITGGILADEAMQLFAK